MIDITKHFITPISSNWWRVAGHRMVAFGVTEDEALTAWKSMVKWHIKRRTE